MAARIRGEPSRWWGLGWRHLIFLGSVPSEPGLAGHSHAGWMWIGHVLGWINTRILAEHRVLRIDYPNGLDLPANGEEYDADGIREG